ncbi:MAG TPA: hypothetical protein VK104_06400, partial [Burkholderiaceae bacterium]|nr:hypothetical protein [Burkholderiaceae bacterium]
AKDHRMAFDAKEVMRNISKTLCLFLRSQMTDFTLIRQDCLGGPGPFARAGMQVSRWRQATLTHTENALEPHEKQGNSGC